MDAVTYPDPEVERYLLSHFVPVQFNVVDQPEVMDRFNTPWTPTLIVLDSEGRQHRRAQGYHDPKRLVAELALGWLVAAINQRDFPEAHRRSQEALSCTEDDPYRYPEAVYWSAVAVYKATGDANQLLAGWNRLLDEMPESEWAKRVQFIRG
jgi:hypothetical protein